MKIIQKLIKNILIIILFLGSILLINSLFLITQTEKTARNFRVIKNYYQYEVERKNLKRKKNDYLTKVAIHEAGHALMGLWLYQDERSPYVVDKIKIEIKENIKNKNKIEILGLMTRSKKNESMNNIHTFSHNYKNLLISHAGHVTEKVFFGEDNALKLNIPEWKKHENKLKKNEQWKNLLGKKKNTEETIREVIRKKDNISIILLLAEALLQLKTINRKDIEYIWKNIKMPASVTEKKAENKSKLLLKTNLFTPKMQNYIVKLAKDNKEKTIAVHEAGHILFSLIYPGKNPYPKFYIAPPTTKEAFTSLLETGKTAKKPNFELITTHLKNANKKIKVHENTKILIDKRQLNQLDKCKNFIILDWYMHWVLAGYVSEYVFLGKNNLWKWDEQTPQIDAADSSVFLEKLRLVTEGRKNYKGPGCKNIHSEMEAIFFKKKVKKIIKQPRHVKTITMLATALMLNKKLTKEEAKYIYKNHKLPPIIAQEKAIGLNWKWQEGIRRILKKAAKLEALFTELKKEILNSLVFLENKELTINGKVYSFLHLIREKEKKSIGNLSNDAAQELHLLQIYSVSRQTIKNTMQKQKLKPTVLIQQLKNNLATWEQISKLGIDKLRINEKIYPVNALTEYAWKSIASFNDVVDPQVRKQLWTLVVNNIKFAQIKNSIEEVIKQKINLLIQQLKNNLATWEQISKLGIDKLRINEKIYPVNALTEYAWKSIASFNDVVDPQVRKQLWTLVVNNIKFAQIKNSIEEVMKKSINNLIKETRKYLEIQKQKTKIKNEQLNQLISKLQKTVTSEIWKKISHLDGKKITIDNKIYLIDVLKGLDLKTITSFNDITDPEIKKQLLVLVQNDIKSNKLKNALQNNQKNHKAKANWNTTITISIIVGVGIIFLVLGFGLKYFYRQRQNKKD